MLNKTARNNAYAAPPCAKERFRLLSWPRIIAFTLLIIGVMTWLYPRNQLVEEVTQRPSQDPLSRAYLDNLIKAEPDNLPLQIKKAHIHTQARRYDEAHRLLHALSQRATTPALRIEIAQALISLHEQQVFSRPPAQRLRYLPALHQALAAMGKLDLDARQRQQLAQKAVAYGAAELALAQYLALAHMPSPQIASPWLNKGAQAALSLGRYREAATLHFEAQHRTRDPAMQKTYFLAGVRALQAGDLSREALESAERFAPPLLDDPDILFFMIEVARAANRIDRAETYAKRLLRFAGHTPWIHAQPTPHDFQPVQGSGAKSAPVIRRESPPLSRQVPDCLKTASTSPSACWQRLPGNNLGMPAFFHSVNQQPMLPFDDQIYRLGYDIFLANRNLVDAYSLAAAAVKQAPDNMAWRQRFAQVAEWSGKPSVSLEQWRIVALRTDSEAAWQAVLRLAPGLFDEETVALALMREHHAGRLDDSRLQRLIQAFEGMGEPGKGVAFLDQVYREKPRRILLEKKAWLEERMGLAPQAIATLRRLQQTDGLDADAARQLAALLMVQGEMEPAYQVLYLHRNKPGAQNPEYQALVAEIAWRNQDTQAAKQIYQQLHARGKLKEHETERLIMLLHDGNPGAAGRLAAQQWARSGASRFLLTALSLHLQDNNIAAARSLLSDLSAVELETLEKQTAFLQQRADVRRRNNELAAAIEDMQRAVQLSPADSRVKAQLLWLLVEARDIPLLTRELARHHPAALAEPVLWSPMGAGYSLLSLSRQALPYYAKLAAEREGDYLWQVGYAQILEETGHPDMAWRVRRNAWLNLRKAPLSAQSPEQQQAMAQLALRFAPGDPGMQWFREWLRQDQAAPPLSAEARELATAWYLSQEQYPSARLWLLQQYGKQLQAPGWAEAALALHDNDRATLEKIVAGEGQRYDPATRAEAALALEYPAAARRIATAGLDADPGNEVLHLQRTESLWQIQNRGALRYRHEETGALRIQGWQVDGQWSVTPKLKMGLDLSDDQLASLDTAQLTGLPAQDRRLTLSARLKNTLGETRIQVSGRNAMASIVGIEVGHQLKLDRRLRLAGSLGYQVNADENAALRAGGMKDTLKLDLNWLISRREYLLAEFSANRFFGQDRVELGKGSGLTFQLGHRLRIDYPDLSVKLLGGLYHFNGGSTQSTIQQLLPSGATALPDSFSQFGLGLGLGESIRDSYSSAFRPYASFEALHHAQAGWGYGLEFGFVVSPTGEDRLRGRYRKGSNSFDGNADASLFDLEYRYLF